MTDDTITTCRLCQMKRAHQRTVTIDDQPVVVAECMTCDRAKCRRCNRPLPGRAVTCPECGTFVNR